MAKKRGAKKRQKAAEVRRLQGGEPSKDKGKGRSHDGPGAGATNPFEIRRQRKKHDVMGQKVSGVVGHRGEARDKAIQLRKRTLLQDYTHRNKQGAFNDRRFGENDEVGV